jgi:hypothetical protein
MKIVNRETFLAMPEGTIYYKYEPDTYTDLAIKGESLKSLAGTGFIDFFERDFLGFPPLLFLGERDSDLQALVKSGESLPMDFEIEGRDGLYDEHQLFAVLEKQDVMNMLWTIQEALVKGYCPPAEPMLGRLIQRADLVNPEQRVYSRKVLEQIVEDYRGKEVMGGMGSTVSPEGIIDLEKVSHKVTNLRMADDYLVGDVRILNTPCGDILRKVIAMGSEVEFRLVGLVRLSISNLPDGLSIAEVTDFDLLAIEASSNGGV